MTRTTKSGKNGIDDSVLVQRALENSEAFGELVTKYERQLDSYVRTILYSVSREDREDILQETFIAAYRYLNSYNPAYAFSTWLYRIAHNQAVSFLRKHGKRLATEFIPVSESEYDQIENQASEEDVEKTVEQLIFAEQIKTELLSLSTQEREVLYLRYHDQKNYTEIASVLRIPEGTVASLIHRAKNKLMKQTHG